MCSFYFLLLDVIYFHFFKYYLYNELLFGGIGLLERKTISKSTEKMKRAALNMFHRATIDGWDWLATRVTITTPYQWMESARITETTITLTT